MTSISHTVRHRAVKPQCKTLKRYQIVTKINIDNKVITTSYATLQHSRVLKHSIVDRAIRGVPIIYCYYFITDIKI